jgi:hypothetical protein
MLHVLSITGAGPARWAQKSRSGRPSRLRVVKTRASDDDDDIIPMFSGRRKSGFTESEYEQLRHPRLLGKNTTVGEELELLHREFINAERLASERQVSQTTENWNEHGDYVGGRWNTLSVLYGIMMASILMGLIAAYMGHGVWWGVDPVFSSSPYPLAF